VVGGRDHAGQGCLRLGRRDAPRARSPYLLPRAEGVLGHAGSPEGDVLRPRHPGDEAQRSGHRHHAARGHARVAPRRAGRRRHRRGRRRVDRRPHPG
jgi:hypothetical protein